MISRTALEIAGLVGGVVDGDGSRAVSGVCGLEDAQASHLSFYGNTRYKKQLAATKAGVVLVPKDGPAPGPTVTYVRVDNPHLAFARVSQVFHPRKQYTPGVAPGAHVDAGATVPKSCTVMAGASVMAGAVLGERVVLYPGVFVGEQAHVGDDTVLMPNVAVMDRCLVGARCLVHAGAVLGADGFGFALDMAVPEHVKIPQAGIVRVEDDVEIGACSCVDRATTGETVVGKGTKIDNLVQVGHNSTIGPLSILCAQVGLSGTTELGMGVVLAGQVGVAGHLRIGDLAKIGAQSGVMSDVEPNAVLLGSPVQPTRDFMKSTAVFTKLPELKAELRELARRVAALEGEES